MFFSSYSQTQPTNRIPTRNLVRRNRVPLPTREDNGAPSRGRRRQATFSRFRSLPTVRSSGNSLRTRTRNSRVRPSNVNQNRFSNVRFERVANTGSRAIPQRHNFINNRRRAPTQRNTRTSNGMISISRSLLIDLLQIARLLKGNMNSRQVVTTPRTVTQPTISLSLSPNSFPNSLSNNIGNQLQNLLQWDRVQNVMNSGVLPRRASIPSSLAFRPIVEEPFGNDPSVLLLPSVRPQILMAPPPTFQPSQLDLAFRAHLLDELGLENLVTDTPDASETNQPSPQKKPAPQKTQLVINTKRQSKAHEAPSQSSVKQQNNGHQGLAQIASVPMTTIKPIRIVFNAQQTGPLTNPATTPMPGPISVNKNQKLIITPSGNYTIQHVPSNNNGFQIV